MLLFKLPHLSERELKIRQSFRPFSLRDSRKTKISKGIRIFYPDTKSRRILMFTDEALKYSRLHRICVNAAWPHSHKYRL